MDLRQREVAKREADRRPRFDPLHLSKGHAGVRTLVVAVLEDQPPTGIAPDVIDLRIQRLHHTVK
jgi:hypothetical protein